MYRAPDSDASKPVSAVRNVKRDLLKLDVAAGFDLTDRWCDSDHMPPRFVIDPTNQRTACDGYARSRTAHKMQIDTVTRPHLFNN